MLNTCKRTIFFKAFYKSQHMCSQSALYIITGNGGQCTSGNESILPVKTRFTVKILKAFTQKVNILSYLYHVWSLENFTMAFAWILIFKSLYFCNLMTQFVQTFNILIFEIDYKIFGEFRVRNIQGLIYQVTNTYGRFKK